MIMSVDLKVYSLSNQAQIKLILKLKTTKKNIMTEYEYLYKKRMCIVLLVGRSTIVELVF